MICPGTSHTPPRQCGVRVLPLYFHGQNSLLFHMASHLYYPARIALLFRETLRRRGQALRITVGRVLNGTDLPQTQGRQAVADHLRAATFALASDECVSSEAYVWPRHVTF
ncbi:MAG: hypothetical protein U1E15_05230 [Hyphomicrobiales bacterium]